MMEHERGAEGMTTPPSINLLQLPDEILIGIFSFLDFEALCAAILVSKHCNSLAEPFLYHTIHILNGRQATVFAHSIATHPRRAVWVRSLLVSTKFGQEQGLSVLPPQMCLMRNLQELRLETPDCNSKIPDERVGWINLQDRYERIFECASSLAPANFQRLLPALQSCTLHFVDEQKEIYSMTKYAMLLLHPTLRSLTMSCASTDYPDRFLASFPDDPAFVKSTALEHLHLEECDIFEPTLAVLLSFPKALKSLKVSEGVRYDGMHGTRNSRLHGNVSPGPFVEAIKRQCRDTLESLSLSLGYFRQGFQQINQPGQHLNLTSFEKLRYLELEIRTVNLVRVRPVCDHATWKRLPPNVEALKVFGIPLGARPPFQALARPYFPFDTCLAKDKAKHGVRHLGHLIFSYEHYREDEEDEENPLMGSDDEDMVDEAGQVALAKSRLEEACDTLRPLYRNAAVRLDIEMVRLPDVFIPPYLFPEDTPKSALFWTSA